MADLIDRQAAIDAIEWKWAGKAAFDALKAVPTADAVEVVRCKDCNEYQSKFRWCRLHDGEMQEMDYCSYGERNEEKAN